MWCTRRLPQPCAHHLSSPPPLQVVSKPGATIDDSEMVEGLVLDHKAGGCLFGTPAPPLLPVPLRLGGCCSLLAMRRWGDSCCTGACTVATPAKGCNARCCRGPLVTLLSGRPCCPSCADAAKGAGGPTRVENAKIALIQFQARRGPMARLSCCSAAPLLRICLWHACLWTAACLPGGCRSSLSALPAPPAVSQRDRCALVLLQISPPKTDIENNVIISDYAQMDRILKVRVCFGPRTRTPVWFSLGFHQRSLPMFGTHPEGVCLFCACPEWRADAVPRSTGLCWKYGCLWPHLS